MPEPPHRRRAHTRTRDLERYAGLFAERTGVMRSSAMRDLMAITARPEVISLAGGLPDTSTFPAEELRRADDPDRAGVGGGGAPVRADRGLRRDGRLHRRGDGCRGDAARPRRRDRHHRRPAGDRPGLQDAGRPRRRGRLRGADLPRRGAGLLQLPGRRRSRSTATRTGCGSRSSKRCSARLDGEGRRPKFVYSVPSFQNPAGVTMSLERRRRLVELARARELLVVEDNPYGLLRFGGEPLPPLYQLDGGDYVIYVGTFSKILSPGIRLGWAVAPPPVMEKIVLGKQAADLCTSTLTQYFVREYFAEGRWREYVDEPGRDLPRPPRRDARGAARALPGAGDLDRARGRPLRLGDAARLHRHRRPAGARRCARTSPSSPARPPTSTRAAGAARCGSTSPASSEDEIREGVRRIGKAIAEQVELYETLTGGTGTAGAGARGEPAPAGSRPQDGGRSAVPQGRRGLGVKVAVLKGGRSLERGVSLRSGARVEDALERLGHEVGAARRRRRPGRAADRRGARRRLHRHARARRRGRHRPGAAGDPRHPLHRPRRRRLRALHGQGAGQARRCASAGVPTPDWFAFNETAFRELGAADALERARGAARLPAGGQAEPRRLVARGQVRGRAGTRCPRRWSPPSATTTGCCSSATSRAASWRSACSAASRCRSSRRSPASGDRYDFEARYEIGRTEFVCPAELGEERGGRGDARRRSPPTRRSAAPASPAST